MYGWDMATPKDGTVPFISTSSEGSPVAVLLSGCS